MRLIRVKNPKGIEFMREFLYKEDESMDLKLLEEGLKDALVLHPDNTFILQVWNEESDELDAFLIALAPQGVDYIYVFQVWLREPRDEIVTKFFTRLCLWAETLGRRSLRAQEGEGTKAFTEKWKFKDLLKIVKFDIPENFEIKFLEEEK